MGLCLRKKGASHPGFSRPVRILNYQHDEPCTQNATSTTGLSTFLSPFLTSASKICVTRLFSPGACLLTVNPSLPTPVKPQPWPLLLHSQKHCRNICFYLHNEAMYWRILLFSKLKWKWYPVLKVWPGISVLNTSRWLLNPHQKKGEDTDQLVYYFILPMYRILNMLYSQQKGAQMPFPRRWE